MVTGRRSCQRAGATVIAFRYDEKHFRRKKGNVKQATMIQNEAEIVKTMNNLLAESRLDRYDIEALTQALSNAHKDLNRWVTTKQRTIDRVGASHQLDKRSTASAWGLLLSQNRSLTQALEKHVLYFDDLINTQRLNEAHRLASDLQKTQDALKQLLADYKKAPTDAARDAILNQIQRLKEQLRELYQRMAELRQEAPDEYLNQEAFQSESMMENAQDLDKMLEEGKMEDVVAALENMIEQTQKMMEGIEKSQEDYGGEEYAALKKEMANFDTLLDEMVEEQQRLGGETEAIYQQALERAKKKAAAKIKKALKELIEKTKSALAASHQIPQEALNSLEKEELGKVTQRLMDLMLALQERYLEEGLEEARGAERALAMLEQSLSLRAQNAPMGLDDETVRAANESQKSYRKAQEVREALEKLIPDLKQSLNSSEKQKMKNIAQKQAAMNDGIKRLRQMMERMNQQVPLFGEEHQGQLNQAGRASRQAGFDMSLMGKDFQSRPETNKGRPKMHSKTYKVL